MSLTVVFWAALAGAGTALHCPQVVCGDTQSHVCAKFTPDTVTLQPCFDPSWCDLDALYPSYFRGDTVLLCTADRDSDVKQRYLTTLMDEVCLQTPRTDDPRRLAAGTHPVRCETESDCQLADGSTTECVCSLGTQGVGYCELGPNDDVVGPLYSAACGKRTDEFLQAFLYTRHFVHLQDKLPCKAVVFADVAVYEFLQAGGSVQEFVTRETGAVVLAAVVGAVVF